MKTRRVNHSDYDDIRLISRVLDLYYRDELTQAEVGQRLGLSTAKALSMAGDLPLVGIHQRSSGYLILLIMGPNEAKTPTGDRTGSFTRTVLCPRKRLLAEPANLFMDLRRHFQHSRVGPVEFPGRGNNADPLSYTIQNRAGMG